MNKLLELEEKLKKAKVELEKNTMKKNCNTNIDKSENDFGGKSQMKVDSILNQKRMPAKEINPKTGESKEISPEAQIKSKKDLSARNKAKAEKAAAERRAKMREEGVLKMDTEVIKFDNNNQWYLDR